MRATDTRTTVGAMFLVALAVTLLIIVARRFSEPTYNGKSLSEWAEQFGLNWATPNRTLVNEARESIQAIGTNATPLLIAMVRTEDSELRRKIAALVPSKWHKRMRLVDESGAIRRRGAYGLGALGTHAQGAVSELIKIATHHPNADTRYVAGFAIRAMREAGEPAIPFLIQSLTNTVSIIRNDAASALGAMKLQPETVVPALIQYLDSVSNTGDWELTDAIVAVASFGTNARAATPLLLKLLDHKDSDVRRQVTNALARIDHRLFLDGQLSPEAGISCVIDRIHVGITFQEFPELADDIAALSRFGTKARASAPILNKLRGHPESLVRSAVTNALLAIDPIPESSSGTTD